MKLTNRLLVLFALAACGDGRLSPQGGTIVGVVAGNGLTGGGSSGIVTLNTVCGYGLTCLADSVAVDTTVMVDGSGTLNYIPLWTPDGNTLGDSIASQSGGVINIAGGLSVTGNTQIGDDVGDSHGMVGAFAYIENVGALFTSYSGNLDLFDSTSATTGTGGGLTFSGYDNGTNGVTVVAGIKAMKTNSTGGNHDWDLVFGGTANGDLNPTEGCRLLGATKVLNCVGGFANNGTSIPDGSGTLNYVPKWTPDGNSLGNSQLVDNGSTVGIGTLETGWAAGAPKFATAVTDGTPGIIIERGSNNASPPKLFFYKTRGADSATRVAVQNGDLVGTIQASGATDGSTIPTLTSAINWTVDGAVSAGVLPTSVSIATGSNASPTTRLTITSSGDATFANTLSVTGVFDVNNDLAKFGGPAGDGAVYIGANFIGAGYAVDADNYSLAVNYGGYAAGATRSRDVTFYDGKTAVAATITGSTKSLAVVGNISTDGNLTSGNGAGDVFDHNGDLAKFGSGDGAVYFNNGQINSLYAYDADSSAGYELPFNYTGFAAGWTRYRDAAFYDGKGNQACRITGSTKTLNCVGGIQVNGASVITTANVSGTTGQIPKFSSSNSVGDSNLASSGGNELHYQSNVSADDVGYLNFYSNGTTGLAYFRDLIVADGKGASIARFWATPTKTLDVYGNFAATGNVTSGDAAGDVFDHNGDLAKFGVSVSGDGDTYIYRNQINAGYGLNTDSVLRFNYVGYALGATRFRDTEFNDGKGNMACYLTASTKVLNCVGGLQVNGTSVATTSNISGTTTRIARFTGANTVGNASITDNGSSNVQLLDTGSVAVFTVGDVAASTGATDWGWQVQPNSDGNVYQDTKVGNNNLIIYRTGHNTESGQTRNWMVVTPSTAAVGLPGAVSINGSTTLGDANTDIVTIPGETRFGAYGGAGQAVIANDGQLTIQNNAGSSVTLTKTGTINSTGNATIGGSTSNSHNFYGSSSFNIGTSGYLQVLGTVSGYSTLAVISQGGAGNGFGAILNLQNTNSSVAQFRLADTGSGTAYNAQASMLTISTQTGYGIKLNTNSADNNGIKIATDGDVTTYADSIDGDSDSADTHTFHGYTDFNAATTAGGGIFVSYTGSSTTATKISAYARNIGTYDTTAGVLNSFGVYADVSSTRSAGSFALQNIAGFFDATAGTNNYALYTSHGDNVFNTTGGSSTFYANVGISANANSGVSLDVGMQSTYTYGVRVTHSTTGVASNRVTGDFELGGSLDATAASRSAYGVIGSSNASRSAGANSVQNIGLYGSATNGQVNYALYTEAGDNLFNNTSGTSTFVRNMVVNGNATIGDATTDTHQVTGSLLINGASSGTAAVSVLDLVLGRGSSGTLVGTKNDIAFQYGTGGYRHFISTQHNSAALNTGNQMRFWLNSSATSEGSSAPGTGNVNVLDLYGDQSARVYGAFTAERITPDTKLFDHSRGTEFFDEFWVPPVHTILHDANNTLTASRVFNNRWVGEGNITIWGSWEGSNHPGIVWMKALTDTTISSGIGANPALASNSRFVQGYIDGTHGAEGAAWYAGGGASKGAVMFMIYDDAGTVTSPPIDDSDSFSFAAGMIDWVAASSATASKPEDGIFCLASTASANWQACTCEAATCTCADTSPAVSITENDWVKCEWSVNAAGTTVDFTITDSGASGTKQNTTNIPNDEGHQVGLGASLNRIDANGFGNVLVDYVWFDYTFSTAR